MKYFLDTSALVKIYHQETGTEKVLELYKSRKNIVISQLSKIEFIATIHRKFREKEINGKTVRVLLEKFEFDMEDKLELLIFSSAVVDEASRLLCVYARTEALRSLDGIQLAFFGVYCEGVDVFVCSDARLAKVAKSEGYEVITP